MKIFLTFLLLIVLTSCKTAYFTGKNNNNIDFNSVAIDTLFQDKISIRAIVMQIKFGMQQIKVDLVL
jgi:hypothetical protein